MGMVERILAMEEAVVCGTFTKFDPRLDETVNVTALMEERHITHAVNAIEIALADYFSVFSSSVDSLSTTYRSKNHIWISIGDMPLSKKLKENITKKFKVDNGKLLFKNWDAMKAAYPDVSNFKHLHGKTPSFVGFPLPEEDYSEEA